MNKRTLRSIVASYAYNCKTAILSPSSGKQLRVQSVKLLNKSGGTIDLGVLRRFGPQGGTLSSIAAGVATDITSAVQAATASTLISTTDDDGFLASSFERFGLIGLTVSQAQAGSPVYAYKYWNGSTWATLPTIAVPASFAAADQIILFAAPGDWVPGGSGITGLDTTKFNIWVQATTAPSTAVKVNALWLAQLIDFQYQVGNNLSWEWKSAIFDLPLEFEAQDGVLPYFGGTANAANQVACQYVVQG